MWTTASDNIIETIRMIEEENTVFQLLIRELQLPQFLF